MRGENGETYAKEKTGPSKERIKRAASFANTRRNNAEFAIAGKATKVFRAAMGNLRDGVTDRYLAGRINAWLYKGVRADQVHQWGERRLEVGDVSLLEGFELNRKLALDDLLPLNLSDCCDVSNSQVQVSMDGFRLRRADKDVPKAATHFRLVSAMLYVDFRKGTYTRDIKEGKLSAVGRKCSDEFVAEHGVAPLNGQIAFWLLGIEFYAMTDKGLVIVRGGALRCMKVVQGNEAAKQQGTEEGEVVVADRETLRPPGGRNGDQSVLLPQVFGEDHDGLPFDLSFNLFGIVLHEADIPDDGAQFGIERRSLYIE